MKLKLLLFLSTVFFFNAKSQAQQDWGVLPFDFSIGSYGAVYALSEHNVLVAKTGHIYSSTDGGESWVDYNTNIQENVYDFSFKDETTGYLVGDDATLLKTSDGGATWSQIVLNTVNDFYSVTVTSNGNVWIVGENGLLISSLDNGTSWQENTAFTTEVLNSVRFRSNEEGFIAGNNGLLLHTEDMGQTWETVSVPDSDDFFSLEVNENGIYFVSGDSGYSDNQNSNFTVSRYGSLIYNSSDLTTWETGSFESSMTSIDILNNVAYTFGGDYLLCGDCCQIMIGSYDFSNGDISGFYLEDLNSSECRHINMVYSDFHIYNEDVMYVLVGENVMKKGVNGDFNFSTENFKLPVIDIYPNPVKDGYFSISSDDLDIENLEFNLYDMNGKLLKSFSKITENRSIVVENLNVGIYFLKVVNDRMITVTRKIVVNQ